MTKQNNSIMLPAIFGDLGFGAVEDPFFGIFGPVSRPTRNEMARLRWPGPRLRADVRETEDSYIVEADFPGAAKGDIELSLDDGILTIAYEKEENFSEGSKPEAEDEKAAEGTEETEAAEEAKPVETYLVRERHSKVSMRRSFALPDADEENTTAKLEDGVLTVTVGKKEKKETRKLVSID